MVPVTGRRITRAVVRGRVQGVGFRHWTCGKASALGLAGWVRNRRDGSVEAVFAGPGTSVDAMLAAVREGPRAASVTGVEIEAADEDDVTGSGFEERPTA